MGFELFIKPKMGTTLGANSISVGKTTFTFGKNTSVLFEKGMFVYVYIDRENNLIAIEEGRENQNAFKVSSRKKGSSNKFITCQSICKLIQKGKYITYREGRKIVFKVPEIAVKDVNVGVSEQ